MRDLTADMVSDLGGEELISTGELALIRRAAMLTLQLEMMEQSWTENNHEASLRQITIYHGVVGALRRTLESIGLGRRPKDVTPPTLNQYLNGRTVRQ
ncbi:MAG TPA: hypothetical protein VH678_03930 [Xanthobacteraceae bacterium]